MKARYDLPTNTLEQLPSMEKPICIVGIYPCTIAGNKRCECQEYNAHIASLQRIPCDPSCREIWADKQEVEEGKDYETGYVCNKTGDFYSPDCIEQTCDNCTLTAVPLPTPVEQDELWRELIDILCPDHFPAGVTVEKAKSMFAITKKPTP